MFKKISAHAFSLKKKNGTIFKSFKMLDMNDFPSSTEYLLSIFYLIYSDLMTAFY